MIACKISNLKDLGVKIFNCKDLADHSGFREEYLPAVNSFGRVFSFQFSVTSFQLPASGCGLPAFCYRLGVSGCQFEG
jgi:hypothetical protein